MTPRSVTLNVAMKKAAVFHYAEWKNSEAGGKQGRRGQAEESWESRATGLEPVVSENPCLNFLHRPLLPHPVVCRKPHAQVLLFVWTINSGKCVLRVAFMGNRHLIEVISHAHAHTHTHNGMGFRE